MAIRGLFVRAYHEAMEKRFANPRSPLGLDYRQIGVEHFLVGSFATLRATAQRGIYVRER